METSEIAWRCGKSYVPDVNPKYTMGGNWTSVLVNLASPLTSTVASHVPATPCLGVNCMLTCVGWQPQMLFGGRSAALPPYHRFPPTVPVFLMWGSWSVGSGFLAS